jgi:hypothetical protein
MSSFGQDTTLSPAAQSAGLTPGPNGAAPQISASEIRKRWDDGSKALRRLVGHYRENVAFDSGNQWVTWNDQRTELAQIPRQDERVRATINRLLPARRTVMAKLHRRPLVFEVIPTTADDQAMTAARMAESILSDVAREQGWEEVRAQSSLSAWLGGTAILSIEWDASAGQPLGMLEDGNPFGTGEVVVRSSPISQVAFPPGTTDAVRATWWVKATVMPTAEAKDRYHLQSEPAADSRANADRIKPVSDSVRGSEAVEKSCTVLSYFERPMAGRAGTVATVIGHEIVSGPHEWPFPWQDRLNVAIVREAPIEDHWAGETVVSAAVQPQMLLNLMVSALAEHSKLAGNARLVISEHALELIETLSDIPGEVIPFDPQMDGVKPEWISPPQLPQWMTEQVTLLQREIDDILGHQEISRGSTPANIQSGLGLSILSEQADTPLTAMAIAAGRAWGDIASMALKLYEANVQEPRNARVDTPGMRSERISWTGTDLAGQTTVTVPAEAVTPRSRAAQQAMSVRLWELGIVKDPKVVAQMGDFPDQSAFLEAIEPDVAKAERENHDLSLNEVREPATFDNHAKHIECHNRFRKTSRYEQLQPDVRTLIDNHILAHEKLARDELAMQSMTPPPLDQTAHADQPPGSPGGPTLDPAMGAPPPGMPPMGAPPGGPPPGAPPGAPAAPGGPAGSTPSEPLGAPGMQELNPTAPPPTPNEVML